MNATETPISTGEDSTLQTRQRLLEAAGQVFAEQGFRNATVRDICRLADANVAAINYHFGDKARLYSETFRYVIGEAMAKYPPNLGVTESDRAEKKLFAFVRSFLFRILDTGRHAWFGKLISREMVEPTHALEERVNENIRPLAELLQEIIRELLGPIASRSADDVRRCATSVIGQIVFYHHCRPVLHKVFPDLKCTPDAIEALAQHVTEFSLSGIRGIRQRAEREGV
jgi:AcrR family transcriptional regulator